MEMTTASLTLSLCSSSSYSSSSIPRLPFTFSFSATNSSLFKKADMGITTTTSRIRIRRTKPLTCNALFGLGVPELVVIAGVAALVFGPKKLPEVGRSIGKTIKSFQQAAKEFESELKKEPNSTDETPAEKPTAVSEQQEPDIKVSSTKDTV